MNPSTALARVLVDELVRCGLSDVVVAPGSRSAPVAMAAHAAHTEGRLRLHVRIDERSAGYLALGLGKACGRPAAVICTSGTATANLHPAVVEASHAGVPLLVLTADRPPELRDTGANQTIDQVKLYGSAVRWFCEVGVPEARTGAVAYWRSLTCRAWTAAAGVAPGPVHLNLAFREPLVPDGPGESVEWPESLEGRAGGAPWTVARDTGWETAPGPHPGDLPDVERGLLVVGDGRADPGPYVALAEQRGWPVLAEPSSGARYGPNALSAYHYLLGVPDFVERHAPEAVLTVGKPGLSRPLLALLEGACEHVVVDPMPHWPDPTRSATRVIGPASPARGRGDGATSGTAWAHDGTEKGAEKPAVTRRDPSASPGSWLWSWLEADRAARTAIDEVLDAQDVLSEPRLARDLASALPDGALLFAGSSMPIRDVDRTMRPRVGLRVLGNRGASGIDGSVSTAVGAALAHRGPAYALLGDLALLHDQNGLLLGSGEPRPDLTIVAVNNDGGGIFSLLPQAAHTEPFMRVFATPHNVDLAEVASTAGVPYTLVERADEFPSALGGEGLRLVEVRTDRAAGAELHTRLQHAVDVALSG